MPFGIAQASEEYQRHIHGSHKGLNGVEDVADIYCVFVKVTHSEVKTF